MKKTHGHYVQISIILITIALFSADGIAQWQQATSLPSTANTRPCISVCSPEVLAVSGGPTGGPPVIYRSSNGGQNWNSVNIPPTLSTQILNIWAKNYDEIYAGDMGDGSVTRAWHTTNGGVNWSPIISSFSNSSVAGIVFSKGNPLVGVILVARDNENVAYITTNGGVNWTLQNTQGISGASINSLFCIDAQFFGFGTANSTGIVHITTNGGSNWASYVTGLPAYNFVSGLAFKHDKQTGIAINVTTNNSVGSFPLIARTGSGGSNWNIQDIGDGPRGFARAKWIHGTNTVYISGFSNNSSGCIKRSTDNGTTWNSMSTPWIGMWHFEYFRDANGLVYLYSVSNNGTIMKYLDNTLVAVAGSSDPITEDFRLEQNYPNPFNPNTKIRFSLPAPSPVSGGINSGGVQDVRLIVYNILGRQVAALVSEKLRAGTYDVEWNASNYPSGVYFYTLTTENYSNTKRMVLVK